MDEKEKICKFEYEQQCFCDDLSKSIHTTPGIPALCARNIKMSMTVGELLEIFTTRLTVQENGVASPDDSIKVVTKELVEKLTLLDPREKIDIITGEGNIGKYVHSATGEVLAEIKVDNNA